MTENRGMNRAEALQAVQLLAAGILADDGGVRRLLERIASAEEPEALRAALTELGARAVLDQGDGGGWR